jgi:hypothetical protein
VKGRWLGPIAALTVVVAFVVDVAPVAAQAATAPPLVEFANPCTPLTGSPAPFAGGGGANNMVIVHNPTAGAPRIRGSVQISQIPGPTVGSVNCAAALSGATDPVLDGPGCIGCSTLAVALQLDLTRRAATRVAPRNVARAENVRCTGCTTVAIAMQYVIPVDDPKQVPPDVAALAAAMDAELRALQSDRGVTLPQAIDRVMAVRSQFLQLIGDVQRSNAF